MRIKDFLLRFRFEVTYYYNELFNPTVKAQRKDYKTIPIIIISFNQLFYLKQSLEFLTKSSYTNIVILDNNSTYPPLLKFFNTLNSNITLHRLETNYGHRVFWNQKEIFNRYAKGYFVVTDPDIVPLSECPHDFLNYFKIILDNNPEVNKVGFSLKIDDIPNENNLKESILKWEAKFWKNQNLDGNYVAGIDTTFALYRPKSIKPIWQNFFKAIRTKYPYIAIHGGWYMDSSNLTEEQDYYIKTVNKSSSWLNFKEEGKLKSYKIDIE
ncbi:glycosyltransferase family A protein [Gelidibacter salicanalis]|uniref:Glycosyltransferase family 2 protein n=1 Tax=Gelidibacter salicanalis TaxID=291193 RepID=A0A934KJE4_9FLAO|nr:glycosyltransferase family A protein [Gelidibacter salicanalis]MBJ7880581.1 glycosyltransferase family 2 protein [Gelidibacter salicanalis]